jgi:GNAT superfamily N-acetyltransferase
VEVRDGRPDDWPAVSALLAELGRPDVRGRDDEDEHRRAFQAYLGREDAAALVAVDGDDVVGFIDLELRPRLNFVTLQAWVPDLIVSEGARSRGAGAALLSAAEERARERGCFALTLESATWRTRAHAFYEREGMKHVSASFAKLLGGEAWPPAPPEER